MYVKESAIEQLNGIILSFKIIAIVLNQDSSSITEMHKTSTLNLMFTFI